MKHIACFFGTFDPVHIGHLIIAQHILQSTAVDEVWMLVSPQNPFKKDRLISSETVRMRMLEAALAQSTNIIASDFEKDLPTPSYTIDSLSALREAYPKHTFSLAIGSDNLPGFSRWKNYTDILDKHELLVYPRPGIKEHLKADLLMHSKDVKLIDAPLLEISSTHIRKLVAQGLDPRFLVKDAVRSIIEEEGLYKS